MFRPRYLKRAKLLRKGVRKFLSYKKDLLSEEDKEKIEAVNESALEESKEQEKVSDTEKETQENLEIASEDEVVIEDIQKENQEQ